MMSALVARSPIVLFQRIPEGWIKTAQAFRRLPQIEIKNFGRNRRIVSSALASRVLTPSGRRRCALATKMLSWSHFVEPLSSASPNPRPQ